MTWVATAIVGGALIGAGASSDAARRQANAAGNANAEQAREFDTIQAQNQPLIDARNTALTRMNALMTNPESITLDPSYQFGLDQGNRGVMNSAAARGGLYSGGAGKALTRYGQDYAGTKLNEQFNRLSTTAGLGSVATQSNTAAGINSANQIGSNLIGAGNAGAASALNQGNTWQNAINQYYAMYRRPTPAFSYTAADNVGPGE